MEFLVHMVVDLPAATPAPVRERLLAAEAQRAAQLADAGQLKRLWRVPGQAANYGLWEAADATELHRAVSSLPLWPWMRVEVSALARHPNDPAGDGSMKRTREGSGDERGQH